VSNHPLPLQTVGIGHDQSRLRKGKSRPGKKNRLSHQRRAELDNKKPSADGNSIEPLEFACALESNSTPVQVPQDGQAILADQTEPEMEPEEPYALAEVQDGEVLRVTTCDQYTYELTRPALGEKPSHANADIKRWLAGEPLGRLAKYDPERSKGRIGRTPTIDRNGCEWIGSDILKVNYNDPKLQIVGCYTYRRNGVDFMPTESIPKHPRKRWFGYEGNIHTVPLR